MAERIKYPAPGCVVEYLENNTVQLAMVLEESGGKLRLLLPTRRETKMAAARILPWPGPMHAAGLGREEFVRILEEHKRARSSKAEQIDILEVWELAQGEVSLAPAVWFAELCETDPDPDTVAAYGSALLACKTHFRFQSPDFIVYDAETVAKRLEEQRARDEREALVAGGSSFLHTLWELASKNTTLKQNASALKNLPDPRILQRIYNLLYARMLNPDSKDDENLWQILGKGLPDVPHLPLQLLIAWGKLPKHYDFWLDRSGYDAGDAWWHGFDIAVDLLRKPNNVAAFGLESSSGEFISIDGASTRDIDDAFHLEKLDNGWRLTIALACPALGWPFGSAFDKRIMHRGTSIYLPEGDMHMLPEALGTDGQSLVAGVPRNSFCVTMEVDNEGVITNCRPELRTLTLAANLHYDDVQAVLDGPKPGGQTPDNDAARYAAMLKTAHTLAQTLRNNRISNGAIIMERPEVSIHLTQAFDDILVDLARSEDSEDARMIVSEMMIAASSAIADWAFEKGIALVHRTQNVTLPKEYAGIWTDPADLTRIMRSLAPSLLEIEPRPHAALGLARYAPITSPLRRYGDLLNEAQIINYIIAGKPRWSAPELASLMDILLPVLDSAMQVQRFRPRYWKLLYFRQKGDQVWWNGVITEENENFASVDLPDQGIFVRGRRNLFDERATPGMPVSVRIGKVNPLYNEIQILETMPRE